MYIHIVNNLQVRYIMYYPTQVISHGIFHHYEILQFNWTLLSTYKTKSYTSFNVNKGTFVYVYLTYLQICNVNS